MAVRCSGIHRALFGFGILLACATRSFGHMYGEHVVELDPSNFRKLVVESASTWVVKFYAPWCGHCKSSAPAFSKAAKKLDGVAKIGVVNCDDHKDLASKYGIQGFPSIKVFKGEGKKARRPDDYNGERTASAIASHVKYVMSSFIVRVKNSGIDAFLRDERGLPHVLLFTDKTSTSPLFKGLSAEFRNLASFGEVRKADAGKLLERYEVESFPTLVAFKEGGDDASDPIRHTGGMDPTSLRGFLREITDGISPDSAAEKPREKVFRQPKAYRAEVALLSSRQDYVDQCGSRKDGRMCGLAFLPRGLAHPIASELNTIAEKYQYDNLALAVVDTIGPGRGAAAFASMFGMNDPSKAGFVTVRARKNKFAVHDVEVELSTSSVTAFLDRLLGGDARFRKLDGDLPEWSSGEPSNSRMDSDSQNEEDTGSCGLEPPTNGGSCSEPAGEPKM